MSGDVVHLRTDASLYVRAVAGGGDVLDAGATAPGTWESFRIHRVDEENVSDIRTGDAIAFQSHSGHYVLAVAWRGRRAKRGWHPAYTGLGNIQSCHKPVTRSAVIVCLALLAGSCGDDGPTAPTAPDDNQVHEYVTLTGRWSGTFDGILFSGDGQAELDHRVPLSGRALAILHDARKRSDGTGLVSVRDPPALPGRHPKFDSSGIGMRNSPT